MVAGESRDKVQREDLGRLKVPSTPRCSPIVNIFLP
jgi:hypothetical protein